MKTFTEREGQSIYCPWNKRHGDCYNCMAKIKVDDGQFACGRLYPPEYFNIVAKKEV